MTGATHLRILKLNISTSSNFNTSIVTVNISKLNISVSVNYVPKYYNAVILNPTMNNY